MQTKILIAKRDENNNIIISEEKLQEIIDNAYLEGYKDCDKNKDKNKTSIGFITI